MLTKCNHLKSISVYRSEIGEDYKVSIALLNGASWCGLLPPSYDEEHLLQILQQYIGDLQHTKTPGTTPVNHKATKD